VLAERGGGQLRIAAGVVSDRNPIDTIARGKFVGECHGFRGAGLGHGAARRDEFDAEHEVARAFEFFAQSHIGKA
jgi:hypothetical protein